MTNSTKRFFIVTTSTQRKRYTEARHREFFSVPVEVKLSHTNVATRLTYVTSPLQGGIQYPVGKASLKRGHQLTNKQRDTARTIA
jgi:hypothetical protein